MDKGLQDELIRHAMAARQAVDFLHHLGAENSKLLYQIDLLGAELSKAKAEVERLKSAPPQATGARHTGSKDIGAGPAANVNDALYLWAAVAMRQPDGLAYPPTICDGVWEALWAGAPPFNRNDPGYPKRLWRWASAVTSVLNYADSQAFFQATVTHVGNAHGGTTNLRIKPKHDGSNQVYLLSVRSGDDNLTKAHVSWNFVNLADDLVPKDLEKFLLQL